jgi:uncharacterized membrane protein
MQQKDALSLTTLAIAVVVGAFVLWLASLFVSFLFEHWKLVLAIAIAALGGGLYLTTRRR